MRRAAFAAIIGAALLLAGCSSSSSSTASSGDGSNTTSDAPPVTVRLGFLTNVTHASALVGLKEGFFAKALGSAGTPRSASVRRTWPATGDPGPAPIWPTC